MSATNRDLKLGTSDVNYYSLSYCLRRDRRRHRGDRIGLNTEIKTYSLEMHSSDALQPSEAAIDGLEIRQVGVASPEFNRFLYETVGKQWFWVDRLVWTAREWNQWVDRDDLETWVAWVHGAPAGYFELERQSDDVEIAFFGLLPRFIGRGLGGRLLTEAIRRAWAIGASRVWVHTCTLDHPNARANYEARGLKVYREETHTQ